MSNRRTGGRGQGASSVTGRNVIRVQPPLLAVVDGDGMGADEAAWAMIADAAELALRLPGLSAEGACELERLLDAALRCARLRPQRRPQASA